MAAVEVSEEMWLRLGALADEVGSTPEDIVAAAVERYDKELRKHLDSP